MIDPKTLKELVQLMVDNDLTELDLQDEKQAVKLRRGAGLVPAAATTHAAPAAAAVAAPAAPSNNGSTPPDPDAGLVAIESPMVGTFFSSPNPDAKAFVSAGSRVGPDTVVCLIEAMKVFNEIKAEKKGTIVRVLVNNGQPVEFGQKLFLVKPD